MKTKSNDSAFPHEFGVNDGLTKREYFAALAIQGMVHTVSSELDLIFIKDSSKLMATAAVNIADALIEALND